MSNQASFMELLHFFHDTIIISVLIGGILGPVGLFLHLRESLFLGAALPQFIGFGFVAASLLVIPSWIVVGIMILLFAVFAALKPTYRFSGMTMNTVIGLGYVVAMAGIVLLLSLTNAEGHTAELLLKGSILASNCNDTRLLSVFGIPLVLLLYILRRRFYLISLDSETAAAMGIHTVFYEALLFVILGIAITLTLTQAGAMACFGFLLLPQMLSFLVCRRVEPLFLVSMVSGALGGLGGLLFALEYDLPAGPSMILVMLALWLIAAGFEKLFVRVKV